MKLSITLTTCLIALFAIAADAFQPSSMTHRTLSTRTRTSNYSSLHAKVDEEFIGDDEGDSTPVGESYQGDVDWDAEWKKVVKEKGVSSSSRPGQDFYKNDAQRAAAKATRAASEQISKVKLVKPDINLKMLAGDAKFWIAMCKLFRSGQ